MKKILPLFLFITFVFFLGINIKADSLGDLVNYIETQSNIEKIKTTIIPNSSMVETKDAIKIISSELYEKISSSDKSFVIGETRAITEEDYEWLLKIVQCEAGVEDITGKVLVANVVFNRLDTGKYGDTLEGVIFASGQFQPVSTGSIYRAKPSEETIQAVQQALDGIDYSEGALYFMNRKASDDGAVSWFDRSLTYLFVHGRHEFFK